MSYVTSIGSERGTCLWFSLWFSVNKCDCQSLLSFSEESINERLVRMEEENNYSTVVFNHSGSPGKENKEESTIYSVVKPKEPTAAISNVESAGRSRLHVLVVCLGILSVLLVTSISAIIYITVVMNKQKASLSDLKAEIQQLKTERGVFENETQKLSRVTDNLNRTLEAILKFDTFPVNDFCPEKKCQPCPKGWILFQGKCYLFFNGESRNWKQWQESRTYCQNRASDLVVISSLQEQEFISKHITFYHDKYHGFWLGLHTVDNKNWKWVDGRNDTLGYWTTLGSSGPCGLMIPQKNLTANWDPATCDFLNKFICECEALTMSD
uniref:C-type lectin domain family 12 member B-like n=1 Tax=Labrus bergylta TaxID=56723 RepID=A0A3Q3FRI1_9LABR|nr:C-type lectin domain family 12 member B-like [Labrus bergylta]